MTDRPSATPANDSGFAAVDALVALMILTISIVLCLRAVETARHAAIAADEARHATQLLAGLLDAAPRKAGGLAGRSPTFSWTVEVTHAEAGMGVSGASLCGRLAKAVSLNTRRVYTLSTTDVCPREATP